MRAREARRDRGSSTLWPPTGRDRTFPDFPRLDTVIRCVQTGAIVDV